MQICSFLLILFSQIGHKGFSEKFEQTLHSIILSFIVEIVFQKSDKKSLFFLSKKNANLCAVFSQTQGSA